MANQDLMRTPIFDLHKQLKARLVDFGGWEMPIQYEGVIAEHETVRNGCGIFDVSHMGEVFVSGPESAKFLQKLTINDINRLDIGQGQYTAMLNENGGMVDDLIIYRIEDQRFLLCVNASNDEKDFNWISKNKADFDVQIEHQSKNWGQVAIQGPKSTESLLAILDSSIHEKIKNLDYMDICQADFFGQSGFIARTGYTGEKGYEIYVPAAVTSQCFADLLEKSEAKPVGLGARDTLRLEACYLLYGNDMNDEVSPIEAGIGWATRMDCGDFIGKSVVEKHKDKSTKRRKMTAFILEDKGIGRSGMAIYKGDEKVGEITSGSHLPSLGKAGGMALVDKDSVAIGDTVEVDVRGKRKLAKIVKRPLYSANTK